MNKILQSLKLGLLHVGYAKLDTSWNYDNVIGPFSRLYLVTKGTAKVYHSYKEFDPKEGYLYFIPSFTYSRYQCSAYHEQFYINFIEEVGDGLSIYDLKDFSYELEATKLDVEHFRRLMELNPNRNLTNDNPKVYDKRGVIANVIQKNNTLSAQAFLETQGLLQLLFSRFIRNSKSSKIHIRSDFYEILNFIKEHLHQPLIVSDLAKKCNLSADHFSRVFQQKFGIRPSKYIQTVRLERSETLLLTTENTLAEIAEKTGWESVSYYTRMFKKKSGKTPGEFRKQRSAV